MRFPAIVLSLLLWAATATAATRTVEIRSAAGRVIGSATLTEEKGGVRVTIKISELEPGKHGMHIHNKGVCAPPDFSTAGDHFNPYGKKHGAVNPAGKHAGDLPNLVVKKDRTGEGSFLAEGVTLGKGSGSLTAGGGTSLVIHRNPDDEKSDPAGGAGERVACGVISPGE